MIRIRSADNPQLNLLERFSFQGQTTPREGSELGFAGESAHRYTHSGDYELRLRDAIHLSHVNPAVVGATQLTLPFELVPQMVLPEFDLLLTDQKIMDAYSPLCSYRNDVKVYISLIDLAQRYGERINKYVWRVQIGYGMLVPASGCSKRALERAWARLELLGYVVRYPTAHDGVIPTTYWVRTLEGMMAIFEAASCTHFRVFRGKRVQLFKAKPIGMSV